jgi:lactate racemase
MEIRLDYGESYLKVEVDRDRIIHILEKEPAPALANAGQKFLEGFRTPIGSPPLKELISGKKKICIVISDSTRAVPTDIILGQLLPEIKSCGIPSEAITILVATGLHRPNTEEELKKMVGEDIVNNYRIVNHDARNRDSCRHIGNTKRGTPIIIDRVYTESDFRILTGLIEPHFMAGFSGGRKAICPGISYMDMFRHFHGPAVLESPMAANAVLDGNPFHEESTEIAKMAGVDFIVNVTINKNKQVTGIFCGDLEKAFYAGADFCRESSTYEIDRQADIVITSAGGHPLDCNLYQSVKGMVGAMPAVREGGMIIIAARCVEEIGSREFVELITNEKELDAFMEKINDPGFFAIDQWELEMLVKARKKAGIYLYSDCLNKCSCSIPETTLIRVESIEEAIEKGMEKYGPRASISVIPEGPYIIPVLRK